MKWSVLKAAREWGIDRETLSKRLERAGFDVKPGSTFHTRDITAAIHGSLQQERIRLVRAQADLREREREQLAGILISEERARELLSQVLGPIRAGITSLPTLAARCNPADPAGAAAVLEDRARELLEAAQVGSCSNEPRKPSRRVRPRAAQAKAKAEPK